MEKSILKRVEALENRVPSDIVIDVIKEDGTLERGKVKDFISEDGEMKKGYIGISIEGGSLVKSGNSLKDLDRILDYIKIRAEKDI